MALKNTEWARRSRFSDYTEFSRSRFAENGKEMYKDLQRTCNIRRFAMAISYIVT